MDTFSKKFWLCSLFYGSTTENSPFKIVQNISHVIIHSEFHIDLRLHPFASVYTPCNIVFNSQSSIWRHIEDDMTLSIKSLQNINVNALPEQYYLSTFYKVRMPVIMLVFTKDQIAVIKNDVEEKNWNANKIWTEHPSFKVF